MLIKGRGHPVDRFQLDTFFQKGKTVQVSSAVDYDVIIGTRSVNET